MVGPWSLSNLIGGQTMLRTFFEPDTLNRMTNGLLLMFIGTFFWSWLADYGIPASLVLGAGTLTLVFDIRDYSLDSKPKPLLLDGLLLPFWPLLRFWIR